MSEALRVLVLGQSNSAGASLPGGAQPWPALLAGALPAALGRPVEVTFRTFYSHASGAQAYLDRELARHEPDLVVLTMTPFAFLQPMVGPGVRRRYGERAGRLYTRFEARFDAVTRDRGATATHANRLARRLSRAVLGAAPVSSYETVLEGTNTALRRIAREEHVRAVAFQGFVRVPEGSRREQRRGAELLTRFYADVRAAARASRCDYINLNELHTDDRDSWYYPDGLHITAEAHVLVARTIQAWAEEAVAKP
ncbi:MAG: SGNH/GDSL hydrolase family protein [Dehalococcoidia bacterium]